VASHNRWLKEFAFALAGSLFATSSYAEPWLEFCDDFSKPAHCQRDAYEERIETERHDFTQSAVTVGRGVLQIEGGYSYFYKDSEGEIESSHTGPELLLRYGISEDIEIRLRWNYAWQFPEAEPSESGSEDLRYSVKLQTTRQHEGSFVPTSALELRGSAPTGGEAYSTSRVEAGFDYIYLWELSECMSVAGSTGYGTDGFGDFGQVSEDPANDRFSFLSQSAVLGLELSESNTMYAEWFGIYTNGRNDDVVISMFNIGIDHYITDNFVLDVRAGVGLSADSDDFFGGVGGGYRF